MQTTLQPILAILDEGLRLYRRGFVGFVLLAAGWMVPFAIGIGLSIVAMQWWGETATLLILIGWMLLLPPLIIYLIGGLSRATIAVQQGQRIHVRHALAIAPQQVLGMGCYSVVFYIVANIVSSIISFACICPLYVGLLGMVTGVDAFVQEGSGFGTGVVVILGILVSLMFILLYGGGLVLSGATYNALIYGIQPFVQDRLSFGQAVQRSIDMIGYRFGRNLMAFVLASIIFGATAVAVTIAMGVIVPLPLFYALGDESVVAQGVSATAWILGLIVVLPPMPIWMALLYQRNLATWQGHDLAERIALSEQMSETDG